MELFVPSIFALIVTVFQYFLFDQNRRRLPLPDLPPEHGDLAAAPAHQEAEPAADLAAAGLDAERGRARGEDGDQEQVAQPVPQSGGRLHRPDGGRGRGCRHGGPGGGRHQPSGEAGSQESSAEEETGDGG